MQTLYLPIASVNLVNYFASAILCPAVYFGERNEDIQSKYPHVLLLCTKKFVQGYDCALEIVFNDGESDLLKLLSSDFYAFTKPLPVSRIKKILFMDERQYQITKFNIEVGSAFLPLDLVSIEPDFKPLVYDLSDLNVDAELSWGAQIDRYNRVLGGCALIKLASGDTESYPISYFSVVGSFNRKIADDILAIDSSQHKKYDWVFTKTSEQSAYPNFHQMIYQSVTENTVVACAEHEQIKLNKRFGKYALNDIRDNSQTYSAIVLHSYGATDARMSLDNFISDVYDCKFPAFKTEPLLLTFGVNKGYSAFKNRYKTDKFECDVKFRLDSQFDYYVIESIYQFVFNNKADNHSFTYIDAWCPKYDISAHEHIDGERQVLDRLFVIQRSGVMDAEQDVNDKNDSWADSIINKLKNKFPIMASFMDGIKFLIFSLEQKVTDKFLSQDEKIKQLKHEQDKEIKDLKDEQDVKLRKLNQEQDKKIKDLQDDQDAKLKKLKQEKDKEIKKLLQMFKQKIGSNDENPLLDEKQNEVDLAIDIAIRQSNVRAREELNKLTKPKLQSIAKDNGLKVSNRLKKAELIEQIMNKDKGQVA